jgi:hypothetical protein
MGGGRLSSAESEERAMETPRSVQAAHLNGNICFTGLP